MTTLLLVGLNWASVISVIMVLPLIGLALVGVWGLAHIADAIEARSRIPASVLLVALGSLLALTPWSPPALSRETLMTVLLAPLLFEGARAVDIPTLRSDMRIILSLAIAGTLIASLIVVAVLVGGLRWPLATVLPFAALIAATDPVAVIATFRSVGLGGRLLTLVESESLLNDAVAAVVLSLVPMLLGTAPATGAAFLRLVVQEVGLACVLGMGAGALLSALARRLRHPGIVSVLQLLGAIAIAAVSQWLHASAVLATVLAGLWVAARPIAPTPAHRDALLGYGHLANTVVFLLIGAYAGPALRSNAAAIAVASLAVLGARAGAVYPLASLFRRTRAAIPWAYQHVLVAGGLRGALALVLILPSTTDASVTAPFALTVGVVAVSVVLQGLAIPTVLRRLGLGSR